MECKGKCYLEDNIRNSAEETDSEKTSPRPVKEKENHTECLPVETSKKPQDYLQDKADSFYLMEEPAVFEC